MANPNHVPLYKRISRRSLTQRSLDVAILLLLLSLLLYRLLHINSYGVAWVIAFFCESCFTLLWILIINIKWDPVEYILNLDRLDQRVSELPRVDMFVTTADPVLEPPIITVNTVLSLLAVNYPANKLACYVSDDGCSPITYFALVEASKFAKIWVPFCKNYNVQVRAPFRYFLNEPTVPQGAEREGFLQEWLRMKGEYKQLCRKLEDAEAGSFSLDMTGDFAVFSDVGRSNHAPIIKVISENEEHLEDKDMPHLVYISREKRPNCRHHYKAGAMNVLTRVSGLMTNAPYMLNVDCDMYADNPEVIRQAMCLFLGSDKETQCAFVQSPQLFYDNTENEFVVLHQFMGYGMVGLQGPFYAGSGCFHRRDVIYGLSPEDVENEATAKGKFTDDKLLTEFGNSKEMVRTAAEALQGMSRHPNDLSNSLEAAHQVAGCRYEHGTAWGKTIGWLYGSTAEDINTGLFIHSRGWKSLYNSPDPPAFLGCAPPGGPTAMKQQKRWATGLLEVLFSGNNPILGTLFRRLQFRQSLSYMWILVWGLRSIPELCYTLLPAYCLINNSHFLPKGPVACIPIALFMVYNLYTLSEYLITGLSVQSWWIGQQFARIKTTGPWLFSIFQIILKHLRLSETVFEVTKKSVVSSSSPDNNVQEPDDGKFVFDQSPYFWPGTTILLVNLTAMGNFFLGLQPPSHGDRSGLLELLCCFWVVLSYWPFLRGFFEKGKYRIPWSTMSKSAALAVLFVHLSKWSDGLSMSKRSFDSGIV